MKLSFNLLCRDIQAQMDFYRAVFGWPEKVAERSAIYRALALPAGDLGFNALAAYGLLALEDRRPDARAMSAVDGFPTITVDQPAQIDALAQKAVHHGGRVVKAPYATYYGNWQVVLEDPEGHVFRITALSLPPGTTAPSAPGR